MRFPLARRIADLWRAAIDAFDRRANVYDRLILLAAMMAAPIATLAVLFWSAVDDDIAFARAERAGLDRAAAIWPTMVATGDARFACAAAGRAACPDASAVRDAKQRMADLAAQSNLLLDPELLSFRLMDLAMLKAPQYVAADQDFLDATAQPSRGALWSAYGRFETAREDISTSAALLAQHVGLAPEFARAEAASAAYAATMRAVADADQVRPADLAALAERRAQSSAAIDALWRAAAAALDDNLEARIADLNRRLAIGFALGIVALSIAASLMTLIGRSIVEPQRRLTSLMQRLCDGHLTDEVPYRHYQNEAGEIGRAVEIFRVALIERDVLNRMQTAERERLEQRVQARTIAFEHAAAQAEESARTLTLALTTAKAGAWGVDLATGQFWTSPEAEAICGQPIRKDDFTDGVWNAVVAEDAPVLRDAWRRFISAPTRVEADIRIRRPNGEIRWIQGTLERMPDGAVIGLMMDVTDRKEQALRLEAATHAAEAANRAKSNFLAMMSHEIRTPLNGMLGMSAALSRTELLPAQREMAGVINQSGEMLLTLLNDVLDLSKIEAGRMELERLAFNAGDAIATVAELYRRPAMKKGLALRIDRALEPSTPLAGDPVRVRQILQNLLSNAVKFTETGAIAIGVRAIEETETDARVRFEVRDTGQGLTAEQIERVFAPFAQAETSTTRRFGGTGLGLSICRSLAHLMGGEIGVESEPGVGSTFWFEARFARAHEPNVDAVEDVVSLAPAQLRILAADDNETNRLVLKVMLGQFGATADFVVNGEEAVAAAEAKPYDVVLMDVHMPVMDGIEAVKRIRAGDGPNRARPIIALSADAMPNNIAAYMHAGCTRFVPKPISPAVLIAAILDSLDEANARDAAIDIHDAA